MSNNATHNSLGMLESESDPASCRDKENTRPDGLFATIRLQVDRRRWRATKVSHRFIQSE